MAGHTASVNTMNAAVWSTSFMQFRTLVMAPHTQDWFLELCKSNLNNPSQTGPEIGFFGDSWPCQVDISSCCNLTFTFLNRSLHFHLYPTNFVADPVFRARNRSGSVLLLLLFLFLS